MKKIVAAGIVLVLLLVVAPWGIGRLAERRVNAELDQMIEVAPYLSIVERKWTGGWFRSEQEVTFEVFGPWMRAMNPATVLADMKKAEAAQSAQDAPSEPVVTADAPETDADASESPPAGQETPSESEAKPPEPMRFTVRNEILHGPVLWPASLGIARVNSRLVLNEAIRKEIIEVFGTDEPVRISTRVGFFGGGVTRFAGDARTMKPKKGEAETFSYDAFHLDVGYSKNFDDLDIDGDWPRFEFNDAQSGGSFVLKDMTLTSNSELVRGDIYDTEFKFGIDELRMVAADHTLTSVEGIHYLGDSTVDGDFMTMALKLGSGKVTNKALADIKLDIKEVNYDFSLRRLHIATLDKLMGEFKAMYKKPLASAADMATVMFEPIKKQGIELLKYDPEFVIDRLGVVTPEGEGVIKGIVRLKGVTAADLSAGAEGLIAKIEAEFTIEFAQKLIDRIPNGATGAGLALDQGYAKRDGDRLVSHIEFKRGELKINGKPQAIPGLGGPGSAPTSDQGPPVTEEPQSGSMGAPE